MKRNNLRKKLMVLMCAMLVLAATGCAGKNTGNATTTAKAESTLVFDHSLELKYSERFGIDYYKGGYKVINADDGAGNETQIVIVPEGMSVPKEGIKEHAIVLCQPIDGIMCASAPTVALLNAMGALDKVKLTTSAENTWYIDDVKQEVADGRIQYVGDSAAPDYEMITASGVDFAVYTRMLTEDVEAQLNKVGVNVLCDYSSVETEPMARVEWAYLYGALFDLEEEAAKLVEEQEAAMAGIAADANNADANTTGTNSVPKSKVAVFYITSNGKLYGRNADDYMAMMVEYAGGEYALSDVGVGETGTVNMEMEAFYEKANDADCIIYVWSMGGKPEKLDDLLANSELLKDFKAVKEGNVWCTTPDYFQATDAIGDMVADIHTVLQGGAADEDVTYLFRLK